MVKFQEYARPEMINGVRTYTTEILEGSKYDMTGNGPKHQTIVMNICNLLHETAKGSKKIKVLPRLGIRFDDNNFLIPDVAGFSPTSKLVTEDAECAPEFVAEVISPTTRFKDLLLKKNIYAKFGILEYWIVDPKAETVDLYTLAPMTFSLELNSCYQNIGDDELDWDDMTDQERSEIRRTIKSRVFDGLELSLKDIFL